MNRDFITRLYLIAVESRWRMEMIARESGCDDDLHQLCAKAALDLFRALQMAGIRARLVIGQNHCFCMVDPLIVDTTATQFRNVELVDGVWIANSTDPELIADPGVWKISKIFDRERDYLAPENWRNWPADERPNANW